MRNGSNAPGSDPAPSPGASGKRARVLVVDDESDVLAAVAGMLERAGYQVACLSSCADALRALARDEFQLLVTDLYLEPDGLGFELAKAAATLRPPVPAVLLTGRPSLDSAQEAMRAHFQDLVLKPISEPELVNACRRVIHDVAIQRQNAELLAQNRVLARVLPLAIEAKDPTTSGHADRVVHYADELARRCGVSDLERESLRMASLLHDIGKVGVPLDVLGKQGPLTTDERELIKRHPKVGYEILAPMVDAEEIRLWVYQHHERWDGRGYPNGLAGEDVALPGRILILAEVFDALAEARSYKPAWPNEQIVEYFRAEAGRHFDPDLAAMVADGIERSGKRFFAKSPDQLF